MLNSRPMPAGIPVMYPVHCAPFCESGSTTSLKAVPSPWLTVSFIEAMALVTAAVETATRACPTTEPGPFEQANPERQVKTRPAISPIPR
jgi:hypothetical protein